MSQSHPDGELARVPPVDLVRIGLVTTFALLFFLLSVEGDLAWRVAAGLVAAVGGFPIWEEAYASLRRRRMTMEFSMALAIVAALAIGEWKAALVILDFVLVAEVLEHLTVSRGRRAIGELVALLPPEAVLRRAEEERVVPVRELRAGDVVVVRPGARLPVDGTVLAGHSFVDESSVTGEALPAEKVAGSRVFAGTINHAGALELRTDRVGGETVYGRILRVVEEAERARAPVQRLADRLAGLLVYLALGAAALTFLLTHDLRATISVVLVAGACGVAAGTPLALLGAIGSAARAGAIVKGGTPMEALGAADTVLFDKTGTLTLGEPVVVSITPVAPATEDAVLEAAAVAERLSEHPLARAVLRHAERRGVPLGVPEAFEYVPGQGVRCRHDGHELRAGSRAWAGVGAPADDDATAIHVARDGRPLGTIRLRDEVRDDTVAAVEALRRAGLRLALLTGDSQASATALGAHLRLDDAVGGLLPEQKLAYVDRLRGEGRVVAMVGDGVNDAPALARASVGIAMGTGTDVAAETAGVVLLGGRITALVAALDLGRRCRRVIRQNFVGTIAVDAVGMLLAGLGVLPPVLAGIVHVGSELAFILNSTRLLPRGRATSAPPAAAPR